MEETEVPVVLFIPFEQELSPENQALLDSLNEVGLSPEDQALLNSLDEDELEGLAVELDGSTSREDVEYWLEVIRNSRDRDIERNMEEEGDDLFEMRCSGWRKPALVTVWHYIDEALDECVGVDSDGVGRFCVINRWESPATFVQTAYEPDPEEPGWRIEWRTTNEDGSFHHFYAVDRTDKSRAAQLVFSLQTVKDVFRVFFDPEDNAMPTDLVEWHEMQF